jgi:hypothetical protein
MMHAPPPPPSSGRRRLKGLLALLPETGTLYPSHWVPPNHHHHLINGAATESIGNNYHIGATKTVTSRKQQRRLMKRLRQEETIAQPMNGTLDLEDGGVGGGIREQNSQEKETIYLSEYLRNDVDVVALFVFDPYQPYSLQLLQKLIDVGRHDNLDPSTEATRPATVPFDMLEAVVAEQDSTITNEPPSPAAVAVADTLDTNRVQGDEPDTTASIAPAMSSKLHCFVVTSCNDMALIDRLLYNSGTVLLPWTDDTYHWRLATGIHSCPAVVSVIECRTGRNLFPIQQEELALDWNASSHIRTAWLHEHKSAFTFLQRIQSYALYPTASGCSIQ